MNISMGNIKTIVQAKIPFDKGGIYQATRFAEDSTKFSIIYDGNIAPHIAPQEYGFRHWRSGKKVEVNKHFIQVDTVSELNLLINTANSSEKATLLKRQGRKSQVRDSLIAQGNLQSIKGNKTR